MQLGKCHEMWKHWLQLESLARTDRFIAEFTKNLVFTGEVWTREQVLRLAEDDFEAVRPLVREQIEAFACGWGSTLLCERSFNWIRSCTRKTQSAKLGPQGIWHRCWTQDQLRAADRPSLTVTARGQAAAANLLSKDLYEPKADASSLGRETLFRIHEAKPSWPTLKPAMLRSSGLRFLAAMRVDCSPAALRLAWLSQLALPGMLVRRKRDASRQAPVLVVCSDQWCFVGMKVRLQSLNSKTCIRPAEDASELITVEVVEDPSNWTAVRCDPSSTAGSDEYASGLSVVCRTGVPLVNLAAAMGFRGMGITHLRKLASYLELEHADPRPVTDEDWVRFLCSNILKEKVDDAKLAGIMKVRDGSEDDIDLTSPLLKQNLMELVEEEFEGDEELTEAVELIRERFARMLRQTAAAAHAQASESKSGASGSGSSASVPLRHRGAADGGPSRKQPVAVHATRGLSPKEGKAYMAPGWTLTKITTRDCGWQARCKSGTSRYRSFDPRSVQADYDAFGYVLAIAWRAHTDRTGEQCPWELMAGASSLGLPRKNGLHIWRSPSVIEVSRRQPHHHATSVLLRGHPLGPSRFQMSAQKTRNPAGFLTGPSQI